ncbi:phasin family protein [Bradyrhizobium sp. LHD-71]|uniref:phasin family protein n=1 Tax=Bradyrhizobium sp. LHD-71 TaxID=3072141 RepID=UPI00280DCBAC|nr:phasin family protein [Bradyrhizobium sp. LHD-71]MDQ8726937.1 phasin family protein [Bradyrhizobium sp. LHD-71]
MNQHDGRDRFESPKNFDIPQNMKEFAEAGFDQARKAFENFMSAAQKTASTFEDQGAAAQANAKEISGKAVAYAEANIKASLDYAERLLKAKDMPEVLKLHAEHVQNQMRALADQASDMGQTVARAAMDATKPR